MIIQIEVNVDAAFFKEAEAGGSCLKDEHPGFFFLYLWK